MVRMGEPTSTSARPPYGRRGMFARVASVLLTALAVALGTAPTAWAADVTSVGASGEQAGQSGLVFATITGTDCDGAAVTLSFQGGQSKTIAAVPIVGTDQCSATAGLLIP